MNQLSKSYEIEFSESNHNDGWAYGASVGMKTIEWPRSRINGLPMAHIFTVRVPMEYRTQGESFVAISLFQADDHVATEIDKVRKAIEIKLQVKDPKTQMFWDSLFQYAKNRHPMENYLEDEIGGGWVLIWLTEAEFNGAITELPNEDECTYPGYSSFDGTSAFEDSKPAEYVKIVAREDDPNTGRNLEEDPDEEDDTAYISMFSKLGEELDLQDRFFGKNHFGGTASPSQAMPRFSPFYIEFEEDFGGANMGGGNGQIDLKKGLLDWACG